jgi:hypothetical protein
MAPDTGSGRLDGNALGGLLSEVFVDDVTGATAGCMNCGWGGPFATTLVYLGAAPVVRCPKCNAVLMTIVESPSDIHINIRGMSSLRIPRQREFGSSVDNDDTTGTLKDSAE